MAEQPRKPMHTKKCSLIWITLLLISLFLAASWTNRNQSIIKQSIHTKKQKPKINTQKPIVNRLTTRTELTFVPTQRSTILPWGAQVACWPSARDGVWIKHASPIELDFLNLSRSTDRKAIGKDVLPLLGLSSRKMTMCTYRLP